MLLVIKIIIKIMNVNCIYKKNINKIEIEINKINNHDQENINHIFIQNESLILLKTFLNGKKGFTKVTKPNRF